MNNQSVSLKSFEGETGGVRADSTCLTLPLCGLTMNEPFFISHTVAEHDETAITELTYEGQERLTRKRSGPTRVRDFHIHPHVRLGIIGEAMFNARIKWTRLNEPLIKIHRHYGVKEVAPEI